MPMREKKIVGETFDDLTKNEKEELLAGGNVVAQSTPVLIVTGAISVASFLLPR